MNLVELRKQIAEKQKALADIFAEAGPDHNMDNIKSLSGTSADKVTEIQRRNAELNDLGQKADQLAELENVAKSVKGFDRYRQNTTPATDNAAPEAPKSLGEAFTKSAQFREWAEGSRQKGSEPFVGAGFGLKTLMETGAGFAPESTRTGRVVPFATRPIRVVDVIPMGQTNQAAVVYMEETTFTNNAAEAAEGAQYGEAAFVYTQRTANVAKIAVWLPVTDEQLEDVAFIESTINNRLGFMLSQRLDSQILVGNGTAPNLRGILNASGLQTQALGALALPDAVYGAVRRIRAVGFADPSAVIFHPNDWESFRLLKTADGAYIWGSPAEAGPARIWGLPVIETPAITENIALVGDFNQFIELVERRGIEVSVGYVNDDFVKGRRAIRADMRVALPIYRGAAFCQVTGI